jgi:pyridoxine 4-dehydrogenase
MANIAAKHNAAPSQVALAWMLKRSPVMLPILGTAQSAHFAKNVAAAGFLLSDAEFAALEQAGRSAA